MQPTLIENFLPSFYSEAILSEILNDRNFSWYITRSSSGKGLPKSVDQHIVFAKNQFGMAHLIFSKDDGGITSPYYPLFLPMLFAIKKYFEVDVNELLRIRIGRKESVGEKGWANPHVDFLYPHKTLLYYANDSDGETIFYNEKYVDKELEDFTVQSLIAPKMGSAILFDGLQYHSSGIPFETKERIAVNINFL